MLENLGFNFYPFHDKNGFITHLEVHEYNTIIKQYKHTSVFMNKVNKMGIF